MPETKVVIFAAANNSAPLLEWLDTQPQKVQDKCLVRIERLEEMGHELRRPEADFLRDGIHELRVRHGNVNYRMLYFFHEKEAVISHGLTKESSVPDREIEKAIGNKTKFSANTTMHTYKE